MIFIHCKLVRLISEARPSLSAQVLDDIDSSGH